jgi:hypothetical protein
MMRLRVSQGLAEMICVPVIAVVMTGLAAGPLPLRGIETCEGNLTPQKVILDYFEARDATVEDVLEALLLRAEEASNRAYRPNLVIADEAIGKMKVTLKLQKAPLSEAFDRIADLPGVAVRYESNQTVVFSMEGA